jgi:hypothetical protein
MCGLKAFAIEVQYEVSIEFGGLLPGGSPADVLKRGCENLKTENLKTIVGARKGNACSNSLEDASEIIAIHALVFSSVSIGC